MIVPATNRFETVAEGFDPRKARSTSRYQRERTAYLRENPFCAECKREERTVVATELDHIIPVEERPDLFWNQKTNWQGLCRFHHIAKTAEENRRDDEQDLKFRAIIERIRRER